MDNHDTPLGPIARGEMPDPGIPGMPFQDDQGDWWIGPTTPRHVWEWMRRDDWKRVEEWRARTNPQPRRLTGPGREG